MALGAWASSGRFLEDMANGTHYDNRYKVSDSKFLK
jgi:hypothetical protein